MKNKRILYPLLFLLALSLGYAYWKFPRQERVAAGRPAAKVSAARAKTAGEGLKEENGARVRLDLLTPEGGKFSGFRQDLFAHIYAAKSVPAPPAPVAPPPVTPPPAPVVVPPPPPPILPDLARFTFLGFLQKEGEKTIFLTAAGEIFLVKKGDRFGRGQQFLITGLTPEQLVIQQGDDPRPIMISLVEQTPLAPARPAPRSAAPFRPFGSPPSASSASSEMPPVFEPPPAEDPEATVPEEMPVTGGAEPPPGGNSSEEGIVRPLPRSDFNNLFSRSGNGPRPEAPAARPGAPTANEVRR